jgi:hypothetical protein
MSAPPLLILVHGTGAGEPNSTVRRWWESESQTAQDLAKASPDGPAELDPFRWTGRNSEKDRRVAGRALLENLRDYERQGRDYRLIGHSHGGSVIWHALAESMRGAPLSRLKGWITVGTPFLQFRPAWTYLWIVLAAVAAVYAACNATLLLTDAWPDRTLVMLHARTFPKLAYVIDALVAAILGAIALLVLAPAGALIARAFPALTNIPTRIRFTIGVIFVVAAFGGGAGFVVWSDLIRNNTPKAGLWATAASLGVLWAVAAWFVAAALLLIYRGLDQRRRDRREREAVARYGPLWQPFTHAVDETVAGLAASRVSPYPLAAPDPGPEASTLRQLFAFVMKPVAGVADDFVWWMLMRRLQGADIWGLLLMQASAAPQPLALTFGFSNLPDPAAQALLKDAAVGLGELGTELREKLVEAGQKHDAISAVNIVGSAIKWTEVVHTLYFRDNNTMVLLEEALAAKPRTPLPEPAPPAPFYRAYGFLPLTVAVCLVSLAAIWALGLATRSLYAAYVQPNLTATQVDVSARAWQNAETLAAYRSSIVGDYLVRLLVLERLPDPASVLDRIPELETQTAARQRLAFAYGFAGQDHILSRLYRPTSVPPRDRSTIHALAGFVAAGRKPGDKLVQDAIDTLSVMSDEDRPGLRELYCTGIPALFAAEKKAEAMRFFAALQSTEGAGCDEAIDINERKQQPSPPCIEQERIATTTALLGKFDDAIEIARTCRDDTRMRVILLRLAIQIDDKTVAARLLEAAARKDPARRDPARKDSAPAGEIVLRAVVLAKLDRLDEASAVAKSVLDNPTRWFEPALDQSPLRPLFNVLAQTGRPEPLRDRVVAAQQRIISKASSDLWISTYQGLELVRMLSEANRHDTLATAGPPFIDRVTNADISEVGVPPRPAIDATEIAILIGKPDDAEELLNRAFSILRPSNRYYEAGLEQFARILTLARLHFPKTLASLLAELGDLIDRASNLEERARMNSIVSQIHLANGDPVSAIDFARKAALPHRVIEAHCRILDEAIGKSATAAARTYGLKYPQWPEPSFYLSHDDKKGVAFRDAFGPPSCEAPWPIDAKG